jgi:hypothetical protein
MTGRDFKGRRGVFRVDIRTAEVTPVFMDEPGPSAGPSAVSPDGRSVYMVRRIRKPPQAWFVRRDLANSEEKELIRRTMLGQPNLSPDGRYIVTPSVDPATNSRTLLLIPSNGGEARELMRVPSEVAAVN